MTTIIEDLNPHDRNQAMRTILYQSDKRANDPVGGCYRYIQELQAQIEFHRAELEIVLQQLTMFRAQHHHQQHREIIHTNHLNNLYNSINGVVPNNPHYHDYLQQMQPQQEPFMMIQESNDNNDNLSLQDNGNSWPVQDSMYLSSLSLQNKNGHCINGRGDNNGYVVGDDLYDNHKSPSTSCMFDIQCDDRNGVGFIPEELVERSDETVLFKIDNTLVKEEADCIQEVQDHDLKGAANLFTLTNCSS